MSQRERRREMTRSAILDAAGFLFCDNGFDGVSMDRIAELAGVTKQTLYTYAGSKEALFLDVVDHMTGGAGDLLSDVAELPGPDDMVGDYLVRFAIAQLRVVMTEPLMKLRRLVIGEVRRFPELGRLLHRRGPSRSIDRLRIILDAYCARGEINLVDTGVAATWLNWLIMGEPVNNAMLLGDEELPGVEHIDRHARQSVALFLQAVTPRELSS